MIESYNAPDQFPDPLADNATKNSKEYMLKYVKAMYAQFAKYGLRMFYNDRAKYQNLANYALGMQPVDKYKNRMDIWGGEDGRSGGMFGGGRGESDDEPGRNSFVNIDWQIFNIATKFVNIMVDKIKEPGYDVECKAIDSLALEEENNLDYTMRALMDEKEWLDKVGIKFNPEKLGFDPDSLPDHSDELEIFKNMNVKSRLAMEGEKAVQLQFANNDFELRRKEYIRDGVIFGLMAQETRNDKNGNTKIKHIPVDTVIIGNSKSENFKDVTHGGYVDNISIPELQSTAGSQFTEKEYLDILKNHSMIISNQQAVTAPTFTNMHDLYQAGQERMVNVMKFYYKTAIKNTYIKKKDSRGNNRIYPHNRNTPPKEDQEIINDTYEVVYEGKWIVNSPYIYDYGMMTDMEVDSKNPTAVKIPLQIICPNMLNGFTVSPLNSMIPIIDAIINSWNNYQHMMAQVVPDGHAINLDALVDLSLGKGGKNWTPKKVLDLYFKRGTLVFSGTKLSGQSNGNAKPIEPMSNNNYEKALGLLNNVLTLINLLRQVSGMNEAVDASTPSPDALVGTLQNAAEGAQSAIAYLFDADRMMIHDTAERIIILTQAAIRRKEISGYTNSIGSNSTKFWEVNKDITMRQYGLELVPQPSKAEWQQFYQQISGALEKGILDFSDYAAIIEITNLKEARQYMAMVEKRKRKEAQQQQQVMMQQQGQIQQQATTTSEQLKQQTLQLEIQLKSALQKQMATDEAALMDKKFGYDLQLKQMEMQQKSEAQDTQARTKIIDTTLKNENSLEVAKHKKESMAS